MGFFMDKSAELYALLVVSSAGEAAQGISVMKLNILFCTEQTG